MERLKLDLGALAVESFDATAAPCDDLLAAGAISTAPCSIGAPCVTIRGCTTG